MTLSSSHPQFTVDFVKLEQLMVTTRGGHKPTTHGFIQTQTKLNGLGWVNHENWLDMGFM